MPIDHFPSTHATWIDAQLTIAEDGERAAAAGDATGRARAANAHRALREHVMQRYAPALTAYVSTPALRDVAERDEIVGGFFARTMGDPQFFVRWRASGMPLRRWLMNAIAFHCRGLVRDGQRERRRMQGPGGAAGAAVDARDAAEIAGTRAGSEPDPADAFDRAWALALSNEAYAMVQAELVARGKGDDDAVFRMHVVDGMTYAQVATRTGRTEAECLNATRRVAAALRATVRDLLREEGVPADGLDAAVDEVLAIVERGGG
jgi:DNA-directed RNA polymerase specialized sigma24 family protein